MPLQGQDLLNLCALAIQNEDLIVGVGKMAMNMMARSPNAQAFNFARGFAGFVFDRLGANTQGGCGRSPLGNSRNDKKMPASEFIQNRMNEDQQERLINRVSGVLGNRSGNSSYTDLLFMILNNPNVKNMVVREIKKFLEGENMSCSRSGCDYDDDDDYGYNNSSCCSRSRSCSRY
ncbi:uncharacterized protein LOC123307274 [Coccinella septempunctata]|uniref:uncharacterized protein LOC123307274 n=1 Tax=Coccinella septempunctata TaxID=41139 RepID=UPI001D084A8E|nr:uncharacterized protein LOC123307274 [Coccinella septempunctata]